MDYATDDSMDYINDVDLELSRLANESARKDLEIEALSMKVKKLEEEKKALLNSNVGWQDHNAKIEKEKEDLKEKIAIQDSTIRNLSRYMCRNKCVLLCMLHILSALNIVDWCERMLVEAAKTAIRIDARSFSDTNLVFCANTMQLFKEADFIVPFGEHVEIGEIGHLLQLFSARFPGYFGILAFSHPDRKIGHAVVYEPPSSFYCPHSGRYLDVMHFVNQGYSKVSLYKVNTERIGSVEKYLASIADPREIYCKCSS